MKRHLQRQHRRAAAPGRALRRRPVLELFCGSGRITEAVLACGFAAFGLDWRRSPLEDHVLPAFVATVVGWIRSRAVGAIWLGTPCTSWTRALRRPLRSDRHPFGLPDLSPSEQARAAAGNATLRMTVGIIRECIAARVPVFLENPQTSQIWSCPPLARLCRRPSCLKSVLHQCQYGAEFKKATTVMSWGAGSMRSLQKVCTGKRGICSRTGNRHVILEGNDEQGRKRTAVAAEYPRLLAKAASRCIVEALHIQPGLALQSFALR